MRSASGPGDAAAVARDALGRAAAAAAAVAAMPAGTGVHRRDQLEARRELRLARGARDRHAPGFERLAQHLEHVAVELRQLVEEQHAVVRERDLARARQRAAADQRRAEALWCGARYGRSPQRAASNPPLETEWIAATSSASASRQRRQDAGEARREHRLAGARRTDHQHAVRAGRGDFERALRLLLALHVAEVGVGRAAASAFARVRASSGASPARCATPRAACAPAGCARLRRARPRRVAFRQHESASGGARRQRHGERAAHRAQLAGERELARELVAVERLQRELAARGEDAERDRQVEAAGVLRQVGRREIDRDAPRGKLEMRVVERRAHAVARFAHLGIGQADDVERGSPGPRCTSTVTSGASIPASARLATVATVMVPQERTPERRAVYLRASSSAMRASSSASFACARSSSFFCTSKSSRSTRSSRSNQRRAAPAGSSRCPAPGVAQRLVDALRSSSKSGCRSPVEVSSSRAPWGALTRTNLVRRRLYHKEPYYSNRLSFGTGDAIYSGITNSFPTQGRIFDA